MANKIDEVFVRVKAQSRVAIMPYLTMGYPSLELSLPLLQALASNGADIIEVGIPHSDPLVDGPVIQAAANVALQNDINVDQIMRKLGKMRKSHPDTAIVVMTYYNIILQYGLDEFVGQCVENGVAGLVVPDLPPAECQPLQERLNSANIHMIQLIPPNLSDKRIQEMVDQASGFIYLVAVIGVTGTRDSLPVHVAENAQKIREVTKVPLALGFGISTREHVATVAQWVDGVIIGSALIKVIADPDTAIARAEQFMAQVINYE